MTIREQAEAIAKKVLGPVGLPTEYLADDIEALCNDVAAGKYVQRGKCGMRNHHETCDCGGVAGDR